MTTENNPVAASLAADIAKHCASFEQSPEYAEMISAHVRKLYEKAIEDTFSWGDFPRAVKRALEAALPANISDFVDLPRYNLLMAKELAAQWEMNGVSERLVTGMKTMVLDFVKSHDVPKYIKASDLWNAFIEDHKEEAAHEGWQRPEVLMEHSEYGSFTVGLEKEPYEESSLYSSRKKTYVHQFKNSLYLNKVQTHEDRKGWVDELHEGKPVWRLYSGKLDDDTLGKEVVQFRGKFDKLIAALYYGDSLLILDADDADEVYYPDGY
ncbi:MULTISPECIES: hypothetical protein [Serratia]|uniref:hypothetical protein n=1 Tax=Serratia TaxID=613 RepID=UPI001A215627|nr:hypothetical protein [Serratia marcescens]MDU6301486.1 hypothetical protein [Serratia marcescens]HEJ7869753.1 hypothetical protein [Serratia marcescens]